MGVMSYNFFRGNAVGVWDGLGHLGFRDSGSGGHRVTKEFGP